MEVQLYIYLLNKQIPSLVIDPQDEIARFRISETWRKHRPLCFRYVSVRRKREIQIIVASFTFPLCFLNGNANLRFRHVSDCRFPLVFVSVTFLSTDLLCVCYA